MKRFLIFLMGMLYAVEGVIAARVECDTTGKVYSHKTIDVFGEFHEPYESEVKYNDYPQSQDKFLL